MPTNVAIQEVHTPVVQTIGVVTVSPTGCPRPATRVVIPPLVRTWGGSAWVPPPAEPEPVVALPAFNPGLTARLTDTFSRVGASVANTFADTGQQWGGGAAGWGTDGSRIYSTNLIANRVTVGAGDASAVFADVNYSTTPNGSYAAGFAMGVKYEGGAGNNVQVFMTVAIGTGNGVVTWGIRVRISGVYRVITVGSNLGLTGTGFNSLGDVTLSCIGDLVTATVKGVTITGYLTVAEMTALIANGDLLLTSYYLNGVNADSLTVQTSTNSTYHTKVSGVAKHVMPNPIRRWNGTDWEYLYRPGHR